MHLYLNKERQRAIEASGKTVLQLIDLGLACTGHDTTSDPETDAAITPLMRETARRFTPYPKTQQTRRSKR